LVEQVVHENTGKAASVPVTVPFHYICLLLWSGLKSTELAVLVNTCTGQ